MGTSELLAENERLKAQLKRAEMERDILKKSIAIFTQTTQRLSGPPVRYRFIEDQSQTFPVQLLCETLQVSRSGYYEWLKPGTAPAPTRVDTQVKKARNCQ